MPSSGSGIASGTTPTVPPYTSYPTGSDVADLIAAAGITLTPAQEALLDGYAAAAAQTWEDMTDLHPFLAASEDSTRRQHAPVTRSGLLLLDRPLATLTSVAYQPLGDTSTALVSPDEYLAAPVNAAADGKPYWEIAFAAHRWGAPLAYGARGSLYVAGRWGYTTVVPANVWEGLRSQAAFRVVIAQTVGSVGAISGWKDADRSLDYRPLAETVAGWQQAWGALTQTAATYRNVNL